MLIDDGTCRSIRYGDPCTEQVWTLRKKGDRRNEEMKLDKVTVGVMVGVTHHTLNKESLKSYVKKAKRKGNDEIRATRVQHVSCDRRTGQGDSDTVL